MVENGSSKPEGNPSATPDELKSHGETALRRQPAEDEGNAAASVRTPFSDLSQEEADLALARRLQEQERAYMMLRMSSGVFGSVEGSYDEEDDDFDDPELDEHDEIVDDGNDNGGIDGCSRDVNGNRVEGHLHSSDGEGEEDHDDVDAFDAHTDHDDDDDEGDDDDDDEYDDDEDDDDLGVNFDPEVFTTDEAYARALQDAEDREMAARLFAIAGIHDFTGRGDRGGNSQDMWEEVDPDELSYEELTALGDVVGTESRGLSADTIASLPSINYKSGSNQNGTNDSCVVCRLDFEDGETLTLLSCKHSYHSECINNWLNINKVCPVCSTEVSTSGHS